MRCGICAGFTLVELLVVVAIIALLLGILVPSMHKARHAAKTTVCLNNIRQIELAHASYIAANDGLLVDAGLAHGGLHADESSTWIKTLQEFYGSYQNTGNGREIRARSPLDTSPHWGPAPEGLPIPDAGDTNQRRRASYGIPDFLTTSGPPNKRYRQIVRIPRPAATVHALVMAYEGSFAGADHVHPTTWYSSIASAIPDQAGVQVQIDSISRAGFAWDARSNYGFLDGHAESRDFRDVYQSDLQNSFDPAVAW